MRYILMTLASTCALALAACGDDTEDTCDRAEACCNAVAAVFEDDPDTTVTCDPIPASATESECQAAIDLQVALVTSSGETVPAVCQ